MASELRNSFAEHFKYRPSDGAIFWEKSYSNKIKVGQMAGTCDPEGYRVIRFKGKRYFAHRIVWCLFNGVLPNQEIDHINGVPGDNRIENLRLVSSSLNKQNKRRAQSNSKTGILGVSPFKGKFKAIINVDKKQIYLGLFNDIETAREVYLKAKRELHKACTI